MTSSPSSYAKSAGIVAVVLLSLGSSSAGLLEHGERERFSQRWWPAHVTLHVLRRAGLHEAVPSKQTVTVRAFLLEAASGPVIMAPMAAVRDHPRVDVELHDGRRVGALVPPIEPRLDRPLVALAWESGSAPAGVTALRWSRDPEMGPGRLAWALERPFGLGLGGQRPAPVLVNTNLSAAAPRPLERYWVASLRSAIGTPLLDASGHVLCVVFRPFALVPDAGLCAAEGDAFRELGP